MNQGQVAQVQIHIDKYFQLDLASLIAAAYPEVDANHSVIGEYSTKEFLSISNKIFNQFREELGGEYIKALPYQYQFQNEFGGGDLNSDLNHFLVYIESNRFSEALPHLTRLIHYQAVNGFWEKSKRRYFKSSEISLQGEKERIELITHQLDLSAEKLSGLLAEIEASKEDLASFTDIKQKELSEIESLLNASRNHSVEITDLHSTATVISEKINALLGAAGEKKQEADSFQKESRAELSKINSTLEKHLASIEIQNAGFDALKHDFEEKLDFVNEKHQHFVERNNYLNDLIGREVGASLFETFKQRKIELNLSIKFWKLTVPLAAIATIAWIFFLFGNGDLNTLSWPVIFINSLKALPAIGLLIFAISQYTKERNFQEEYAFKSAVALTVNAYADQLINNENKDTLIMNSVNSIYKSPTATKGQKQIDEKTLTSATKDLADAAKSFFPNK